MSDQSDARRTKLISSVDYRELLKKYMQHIINAEGVHFLDTFYDRAKFSEEENAELQRIANELENGE
jgi:uncharacterized membrane protein YqhA